MEEILGKSQEIKVLQQPELRLITRWAVFVQQNKYFTTSQQMHRGGAYPHAAKKLK